MRFVLAEHGNGIGALQRYQRGFDGLKQVAVVQAVHQMGNDLGVGLALKDVTLGLQGGA